MASIQPRRNKDGVITSYTIKVFRGRSIDGKQLKPYTTSFKVPINTKWSEETALKKAAQYAAVFEKECREGLRSDSRLTFAAYCDYVLKLKEDRGTLKHSTLVRYRELAQRINERIGHIKLIDLRADKLNDLYSALSSDGMNKRSGGKLSKKTILEHHRLISSVLEQAVKEGLILYNVAERAQPPKVTKKEAECYQPNEVQAIISALEHEPIKWKTLVHLFLITGARRGEILGLKWDKVDFSANEISITSCILYTPDRGVYEDTPKTPKSKRKIILPNETMELLREYRSWQLQQQQSHLGYFVCQGYVFAQEDGSPMHPDSVTTYLTRFSKQYDLPHIHAHGFRHTMASMLFNSGQDLISISSRLGHSQPSTTANIYAHVIEGADKENADILANAILKQA